MLVNRSRVQCRVLVNRTRVECPPSFLKLKWRDAPSPCPQLRRSLVAPDTSRDRAPASTACAPRRSQDAILHSALLAPRAEGRAPAACAALLHANPGLWQSATACRSRCLHRCLSALRRRWRPMGTVPHACAPSAPRPRSCARDAGVLSPWHLKEMAVGREDSDGAIVARRHRVEVWESLIDLLRHTRHAL